MEDFIKLVLDLLGKNWALIFFVLSVFVEIVPVKIKFTPLKWIGKILTGEVREDIKKLDERMDKQEKDLAEFRNEQEKEHTEIKISQEKELAEIKIAGIKRHVLDFANSCRHGVGHTKEDFVNIIAENNDYEDLVKKLEKKNDVYTADFEFIKAKYRECQENNSFLA